MPNKIDEFFASSTKLLWIVRACVVGLTFSIAADALVFGVEEQAQFTAGLIAAVASVAIMIGVVAFDMISGRKDITTLSAIGFGLLGGLAVSYLFWSALSPVVRQYLNNLPGAGRGSNPPFNC